MSRQLFWFLSVALLILASPAWADPPTGMLLPLASYRVHFATVSSDIEVAAAATSMKMKLEDVTKALADLASITRCDVIYGDTIIFVDNRPLRNTLLRSQDKTTPDSRRSILLNALVKQTALVIPGLDARFDDARPLRAADSARDVLREPMFGSDPYPAPSWLDKKMDDFGDWLSRMLKKLFGHSAPVPDGRIDPDVARAILITILILAAAFLCYLVYRQAALYIAKRQTTLGKSAIASGLAINELEAALVSARDYKQLMLMAQNSSDQGDFRTAFRLVYLATLVLLDTTGDVRIRRSKTNWEYLSGIHDAKKQLLYDRMLPLTEEFDRIWYGFGHSDVRDFKIAVQQFEEIKALVLTAIEASSAKVRVAT